MLAAGGGKSVRTIFCAHHLLARVGGKLTRDYERLAKEDRMQLKVSPVSAMNAVRRNGRRVDLAAAHRAAVMHGFHEGIFNPPDAGGAGQARPLLSDSRSACTGRR